MIGPALNVRSGEDLHAVIAMTALNLRANSHQVLLEPLG